MSSFNSEFRIIRFCEVRQLTGLSRSTIDRLERAGQFCRRVKLGLRSVGWILEDVMDWLRSRK